MSFDTPKGQSEPKPADRGGRILAVVLVYAMFAAGWILLSDKFVQFIFSDPDQIILASILKGWLFVCITSLLLYRLMRRQSGADSEAKAAAADARQLNALFLLLAAGILGLTFVGIAHTYPDSKKQEVARLQAVADLKSRQIADWLRERQGDADFARTSVFFAEQYQNWRKSEDSLSYERLQKQLEQFRRSQGFAAITLLNSNGEKLWGSDKSTQTVAPSLQTAARLASTERKGQRLGPYRGISGQLRLDFVFPLAEVSGPAPVVVLHVDPAEWLFPTLQNWPTPSVSGETLLFRRDGDRILYLNELRHQQDTAAKLRRPLATEKLLAAQVLSGGLTHGEIIEGVDYRGIPAIGAAHAVVGSDWILIAKLDKSEIYAEAAMEAEWIGFSGLLVLLMTGAGFYLLKQNQQLALIRALQQTQAERLRALSLLAAIADCSDDAIFAKDLEGRYILFNRAAANFVGKPAVDVLDRGDYALFPAEQAENLTVFDRRTIAENRIQILEEVLSMSDGERTFLTSKGPLHDAENNIIGLFGISRDITERKRAEHALRESENRFRVLVEQSLAGIFIIQDNRFRYINPAFAAILGYDAPEALIDRVPVTGLISPEDRGDAAENMRRIIEGEISGITHYTFAALRLDGSRIDVEAHGSSIDYQGRPAIIGLVLDISARKAAEEALHRQTEELSQYNAELERFNRATVGRELDMIALKQQVNELSRQLGQEPRYSLTFLESSPEQTKQGDSQ